MNQERMIKMSMDLCLVDGFGICLDNLNWKSKEELTNYFRDVAIPSKQITFYNDVELTEENAETIIHRFIVETIEDELSTHLQYASVNDSYYIYAPTIFPTQADVTESKIWTRKELGHEIYQLLKDFIHNPEDDVADRLGHVFDWEMC